MVLAKIIYIFRKIKSPHAFFVIDELRRGQKQGTVC